MRGWAGEPSLPLVQVVCDEESNENAAIPAALDLVDFQRVVVTIDAAGTDKAITAQVVDRGADGVGP